MFRVTYTDQSSIIHQLGSTPTWGEAIKLARSNIRPERTFCILQRKKIIAVGETIAGCLWWKVTEGVKK